MNHVLFLTSPQHEVQFHGFNVTWNSFRNLMLADGRERLSPKDVT